MPAQMLLPGHHLQLALCLKELWKAIETGLCKSFKEKENLMFKNDYLEQQIEALCQTLAALIFGQELTKEILTEEEERGLEISVDGKLTELLIDKQIKNGKMAAAQSMIAELIKSQPSAENLVIALGAYNKMLENNEEDENLKNEIIKIRDLYLKERQK